MAEDKRELRISEEEETDEIREEDMKALQLLFAMGRFRNQPEDYWEKEGIGWK